METVEQLLLDLATAGINVYVEDGKLKTRAAKGAITPALGTRIKAAKDDLIRALSQGVGSVSEFDSADRTLKWHPTSSAQQRMLFMAQAGSNAQYNIHSAYELTGELDVAALEAAFNLVINHHEALRVNFRRHDEQYQQQLHDQVAFKLQRIKLTSNDQQQVDGLIAADAAQPFDLANDLLIRALLIELPTVEQPQAVLALNVHHLVTDGWSMALMIGQFVQAYQQIVANSDSKPQLPASASYIDYCHWQQQQVATQSLASQIEWWQDTLKDIPTLHALPMDLPRPAVLSDEGDTISVNIAANAVSGLEQLAKQQAVSLNTLMQAMFSLWMGRVSLQQDVVLAIPSANRDMPGVDTMVGLLVNTLVARAQLDWLQSFIDLLAQVGRDNRAMLAHQDVPFERLVEALKPVRSQAHSPVCQIAFSFDAFEPEVNVETQGLAWRGREQLTQNAKFELTCNVAVSTQQERQQVQVQFEYNSNLFSRECIERLLASFVSLIDSVLSNPQQSLAQFDVINEAEQQQLLAWGETANVHQQDTTVVALLAIQTQLTPEAKAVVEGDRSLTFAQLQQQADALAVNIGAVEQGQVIASCMNNGIEAVVAMLAIFKLGGVYLPIDPAFPQERVSHMLTDADVEVVLTGDGTPEFIAEFTQCRGIDVALVATTDEPFSATALNPENPAYMIYTSGTTGKPKGVVLTHGGLAAHCLGMRDYYGYSNEDKILPFFSMSVDGSLEQLFSGLLAGSQVHLRRGAVWSVAAFYQYVNQHQITATDMPPAYCLELLTTAEPQQVADFWQNTSLTRVVTGGDAMSGQILQSWQQLGLFERIRLINAYGPTETTITSTVADLTAQDVGLAPSIGRGTPGTRLYVFSPNAEMKLQPAGALGELYIGGQGVALGYHNQADLTAARFLPDPFVCGERIYQTGDLVRWQADGRLQFVGRVDDQVKVRGFRVELEEVKQLLLQLSGVSDALVVAVKDERLGAQLNAYITLMPQANLTVAAVRQQLALSVPSYMIPTGMAILAALPVNVSGWVSRKDLPAVEMATDNSKHVPLETQTERRLAALWAELLDIPAADISRNSDLFTLGGHSIVALRLLDRVGREFNQTLTIQSVFEQPVLSQMALLIDTNAQLSEKQQTNAVMLQQVPLQQKVPLSFAQRRLYFVDKLSEGATFYNMLAHFALDGEVSFDQLTELVDTLLERHHSLRSVVLDEGEQQYLHVLSQWQSPLQLHDLQQHSDAEQQAYIAQLMATEANYTFDLHQDLMLRVHCCRLADKRYQLVMNFHHIATDGWSMNLLIGELEQLLSGVQLAPLPYSYRDYSHWQQQQLQGEALERLSAYWQQTLADMPQLHSLPLDKTRPAVQTHQGDIVSVQLPTDLMDKLQQIAQQQRTTIFSVVHSVLAHNLSHFSGEQDIVIGTPVANRPTIELQNVVGFFVNTIVLRTQTAGFNDFVDYLAAVKQADAKALDHQQMPFELLVERLAPVRSTSHSPLFQILFSYEHESGDTSSDSGASHLTPMTGAQVTVHYDLTVKLRQYQDNNGQGADLAFEFNQDLFTRHSVKQMLAAMTRQLELLASEDISQISMDALQQAAAGHIELPRQKLMQSSATVLSKIEQSARQNLNATVVVCGEQSLNYQALLQRADSLAAKLQADGLTAQARVAVCLPRSVDYAVAMLAIFKAGGVYVPMDIQYPEARLSHLFNVAKPQMVVTLSDIALPDTAAKRIALDAVDLDVGEITAKSPQFTLPQATDLAYLIFTSGSTGLPKAVMINHEQLAASTQSRLNYYGDGPSTFAMVSSFAFDSSIAGLVATLCSGGTLVLPQDSEVPIVQQLPQLIAEHQVSHLLAVPSMYRALLQSEKPVLPANMICAGEALTPDLVALHFAQHPQGALYNEYGPTEATVWSSVYQLSEAEIDSASIPIGFAPDHARLLVVDNQQRPVAQGAVGELLVLGAGVGCGYFEQPEATAEKFINITVNGEQSRGYLTGDLVRWRNDGQLVFLGRDDGQVKLRGYRIETGEVATVMAEHPQVSGAQVILQSQEPAYLSGFYLADKSIDDRQWRQFLAARLPSHMVPLRYTRLDVLPLTANGKVDKVKLASLEQAVAMAEGELPQTEIEKQLAELLQQLLKPSQPLTLNADFFALGGHSLLIIQLINQIEQQTDAKVTVREVFEHPTLGELAQLLTDRVAQQADAERFARLSALSVEANPSNNNSDEDHESGEEIVI